MYSEKCEKCNTLNQSGRITSLCEKCLEIVDENNLKVGNKESDNESDESDESSDSNEESDEKSEELDAEVDDDDEPDIDEPDIDEPNIDESVLSESAIVESILYDSDLKKSDDLLNHRIIVDPDRRITSNVITQLEIARAIAIRAANIDARGHDNAFVDT